MRALADEHRSARARRGSSCHSPKQLLGVAGAVDEAGVEEIAAGLEEGVEQDRARGEAAEILEAERHHRRRLSQAGDRALGDRRAARLERPAGERAWCGVPAFSISYSSPTAARHLSSTRRLPRLSAQLMPGAGEFLLAGADGLARGVDLEGIEMAASRRR